MGFAGIQAALQSQCTTIVSHLYRLVCARLWVYHNLFCTHGPGRAWAYRDGILHVTHAYARLAGRPPLPETPEEVPHWDGEIPA
jgi:hypothetical protein